MNKLFVLLIISILTINLYGGDSLEVYTFKTIEDAELFNNVVNDSNGYPRQDAICYRKVVYHTTLNEYILILDKVTYKILKDLGIKVKKIKDKLLTPNAILQDKKKLII